MIHVDFCTTGLDFAGDCEWEWDRRPSFEGDKHGNMWIICKAHPNGGGWQSDFEDDARTLPMEELKKKWDIKDIQRCGKWLCRAGYINFLHPEKSWTGHNPETLEKLKRYMEQLEKENGSKSGEDSGHKPG